MSLIGALKLGGGAGSPLIKTSTVDTENNSLSERLAILTDQYDGQTVTFYCVEGELTEAVTLNDNHSLHFAAQEFTNTVATHIPPPITVGDNCTVTAESGAIIYESNISTKTALIWTKDGAQNVLFDGLYFKGIEGNADPGGLTGIWLLNAKNSIVRNCTFDNCHNYNVVIGKYPATPGYSDGCIIENNTFLGFKTQNVAVTDGINWAIRGNTFDYTGDTSSGPYFIPIDIEPNNGDEVIDDWSIDGNTIITRGSESYYMGIYVQGDLLLTGMNHGSITNNTIWTKVNEATYSHCQIGIKVDGVNDLVIQGNYAEGTQYSGYVINDCKTVTMDGNELYNCYYGISLGAVADSTIDENVLTETDIPNPGSGNITETEFQINATATGSQITALGDVGGSYWKFKTFQVGLPIVFNNTVYTIQSVDASVYPTKAVMSDSVGTVTTKTFTSGNVTNGTGNIAITGHGFANGAAVNPSTSGTLPNGLAANTVVYVIRIDANNIKLATTLANALAGTAMTYTDSGTGTNTLTPVLLTQFSSNTYEDNIAPNGIHLNPNGISVII